MKNITAAVPFGKSSISFSLPAQRFLGILRHRKEPAHDLGTMLANSLDAGPAGRRLERLVSGRKSAIIVVTDLTRKSHLKEMLPGLIARLRKAEKGVAIDVIVALGMHKRLDRSQLEELLGKRILRKYRILQHSQRAASLVRKGVAKNGVPIILNSCLERYEVVLSIGVIEPHLYAGYSGGAKTVAIGLAGEETIRATHDIRFIDGPGVGIGSIRGNPFQKTLWEIAGMAGLGFSVNVVNDPSGNALRIFSGAPKKVFADGVRYAGRIFEVKAAKEADIAVCGIGYPKDINLYQASRALNYVANTPRPVVRKGGALIVAAELQYGAGSSAAERRFCEALKNMRSPAEFIKVIKNRPCAVGDHRAYMVAKAMLAYNVILVTKSRDSFLAGLPFPIFDNIGTALTYADRITLPSSKIYVIPHALSTIPKIS